MAANLDDVRSYDRHLKFVESLEMECRAERLCR